MRSYGVLILALLCFSCNEIVNEHAPAVNAEIVAVGSDYVTIKWNNVGDEYTYGVVLSKDTVDDNDFRSADSIVNGLTDTVFSMGNLESKRYYKIKVSTHGDNIAPNESFPPLRFQTN